MDFSRRVFLRFASSTTLFFLGFFALSKKKIAGAEEPVLRPPGAIDEEAFTTGCLRCGICIDVCRNHQTGVLKAMTLRDGYSNVGLPYFASPDNYCARCLECTLVCPTRVLQRTTLDQLGIGTAYLDPEKCVLSNGEFCDRCFDLCELEAIIEDEDHIFETGRFSVSGDLKLRFPKIIADVCDGCGLCAYTCPAFELRLDASKRQSRR
ncbi:MAG: hypothetical protein WDA53_00310 [Bacillota bacterium]